MGKDYSVSEYKKTYEGDYTKKYKDAEQLRLLRAERQREYAVVSKKLGTTSYSKEVKNNHAQERAEGRRVASVPNAAQPITKAIPQAKPKPISRPPISTPPVIKKPVVPKPTPSIESKETRKTVPPPAPISQTPPPTPKETKVTSKPESQREKSARPIRSAKTTNSNKKDFSYINMSSTTPPVEIIQGGKYRDVYTQEIIDAGGVKARLLYAGYRKMDLSQTSGILIFIYIIGFLIPLFGPIMLFKMGGTFVARDSSTYEKKNPVTGAIISNFNLPIDSEDEALCQKRAKMMKGLGLAAGVFQFYIYVFNPSR